MRRRATPIPFELQCRAAGLPEPQREFRFHPKRRWRFDYVFPFCLDTATEQARYSPGLALEVDGGIFVRGRHSGGVGQLKDMEKLNAAAILGYCVLRVTPKQIADGTALALVEQAIRG